MIALYGAGGYLIVFQVSREVIRNEMHAAIERNDTKEKAVNFSFSKAYWETIRIDDKEFMLDGKMYDIVSYKETKNNIIVSAICDSKENNLLIQFSQAQPHSDSSRSLPERLIHFLYSMITEENAENSIYFIADQVIGSSIILPVSSPYHAIIYSPPDFMRI